MSEIVKKSLVFGGAAAGGVIGFMSGGSTPLVTTALGVLFGAWAGKWVWDMAND